MFVRETIAVKQFEVKAEDLNYLGILFGGKLLAEVDTALAQSAYKFTSANKVTGSVDKFRFIKPLKEGETVTIKSMVSGNSNRVIEVFGQVYNSEDELAAYAILTFIVLNKEAKLPELIGETDFEKQLLAEYQLRAKNEAELHELIHESLNLDK